MTLTAGRVQDVPSGMPITLVERVGSWRSAGAPSERRLCDGSGRGAGARAGDCDSDKAVDDAVAAARRKRMVEAMSVALDAALEAVGEKGFEAPGL